MQQHSHISGPSNSSSACQGSHLTLHGPSSSNSMHPVGLGVGINGGSVAGGGGAGTSGNVTVGAQVSSGGSSGTSLLGQPPPASSATPVMLTNSISGAFGNCMPSVNPSNVNSGPSSRHFSMNTGSNNINNHPGNSGSRSRKLLHHQQQQSQQQQQHHSGQSHFSQHLPVSSSVHVGAASTLSSGMLAGHSVGATTGSGQLMLGLNASGTHARPTSLQMTGSTNSGLPSATANAPSGSAAAVAAAVTAASLISAELRKKQLE
ncbi:unnamed protein product [Protopolystoma xenopodis]|uniref:Uncharacterized protein n=1 Tax=Protopolystoma xenopodis TaxID=117903 RepID=A0A448WY90_9PLAT|nr:unnamed protein product [Protopolystoma xenopodis]